MYSSLLLIYALLSWFHGAYDSSLGRFISKVCEPYLRLFDRLNLRIGMISFNILVAIIVLNVVVDLLSKILWMM